MTSERGMHLRQEIISRDFLLFKFHLRVNDTIGKYMQYYEKIDLFLQFYYIPPLDSDFCQYLRRHLLAI